MNKESRARRLRLLSLKGLAKSAELSPEEKKRAREASMKQVRVLATKINDDGENEFNTWTAEASCIDEDGAKVPVIKIKYNKGWPQGAQRQQRQAKFIELLREKFTNKIYVKLSKSGFMQHKKMFTIPCFDWNYPNCKEASADTSGNEYNPCLYFLQRIQPEEWPMSDSTEPE